MSNVEMRVVEDVKAAICDKLDEFDEEHLANIVGSELAWELFAEENANGTITFSRARALEYLQANPQATDATIKCMIEELGTDWEDVYANGEDYDDYVRDNAEAVHVTMYLLLSQNILSLCPTVSRCHSGKLGSSGSDVGARLADEVMRAPASEAWI